MSMLENATSQRAKKGRAKAIFDLGGHDRLHLFPTGHPAHRDYMTHCWCMCQKCFRPYPSGGKKGTVKIGRCICPACPCHGGTI